MDISKLKLEKFEHLSFLNFPSRIKTPTPTNNMNPQVIIYFIDKLDDIKDFNDVVIKSNLPKENRVIYVYEKGRKDGVNRDSLFEPFKTGIFKNYKLRAPMLTALSKELSAFVQSYEGVNKTL